MITIKSYAKAKKQGASASGYYGYGGNSQNITQNTIINSSADDWFYWNSSENSVHCRYTLVGDSEVAAWGLGDSSGGSGSGGGCDCVVIDNLYSDSSTSSLSANMGSTLREMIEGISM